jgi:K+-sensing histidine kinase KdpD
LNLLSNALKFTFKGFIKISTFYEATQNAIKIEIQDSGIGINESDIPNLFKCFGMLKASSRINTQGLFHILFDFNLGTGLGLYLCAKITKLLGGKILVTSQIEIGTTFTFWIKNQIPNCSVSSKKSEDFSQNHNINEFEKDCNCDFLGDQSPIKTDFLNMTTQNLLDEDQVKMRCN